VLALLLISLAVVRVPLPSFLPIEEELDLTDPLVCFPRQYTRPYSRMCEDRWPCTPSSTVACRVAHDSVVCRRCLCTVMLTFVVYGTLGYRQYKKLCALPPQPFAVLASPIEATLTTASEVELKDQ
jgi:hypothetical protein